MPKPRMFKVAKCDLKRTTSIQQQIFIIRGQRVLMDADLAKLCGVTTKRLNQQLKRNLKRFPANCGDQFHEIFAAIRQLMALLQCRLGRSGLFPVKG